MVPAPPAGGHNSHRLFVECTPGRASANAPYVRYRPSTEGYRVKKVTQPHQRQQCPSREKTALASSLISSSRPPCRSLIRGTRVALPSSLSVTVLPKIRLRLDSADRSRDASPVMLPRSMVVP